MYRISKSMVGSYSWCPFKVKLHRNKVSPTDPVSFAMMRGKHLHDIFENFYYEVDKDEADKHIQEQDLFYYFQDICTRICPPDLKNGQKDIENFCKWNVDLYTKEPLNFFPMFIEQKIYLPFEDIVGVIDRVDVHDGKVRIIDYKSGYGGAKDIKYFRFELSMYVHLIQEHFGVVADEWGIYYCGDNTLLIEDVNHAYYERYAKNKINKLKYAIDHDEFPRTEWTSRCDRCEFFSYCWR